LSVSPRLPLIWDISCFNFSNLFSPFIVPSLPGILLI
jgi:hypothetical protein